MIVVTLYRRADCPECDQAESFLTELQSQYPHQLAVVDIDREETLGERYRNIIPVIHAGPYHLRWPFTKQDLQVSLGAAIDRAGQLERVSDENYQRKLSRGHTVSGADRFSVWFSQHYMVFINLLLLLYLGLPFLAPVFAKAGAELPARIIYTIYKPLCHQLSFRSWFLFGPQPAYPLERAEVPGLIPYEQAIGEDEVAIFSAREFIGNEAMGYKVALCERDVAIWGAMLLFGLLFAATGRKSKAVRWYFWLVIGVAPLGLDGVSQLPSLLNIDLSWLPIRESTPLLRTVTGALFGWLTAWFLFPMIEESMRDTRAMMSAKVMVVEQVDKPK